MGTLPSWTGMRFSTLPASQQLVGTITPAFDQPRTHALPLPIVCHLLGSGNQLHPTGLHQPALPLSHRTSSGTLRDFTNLPYNCPIAHPAGPLTSR